MPCFWAIFPMGTVYAVNKRGPRTDPWGSPKSACIGSDNTPAMFTWLFHPFKYEVNHWMAVPLTPKEFTSRWHKMEWSTVSNAALISKRTMRTTFFDAISDTISCWTLSNAVSVQCKGRYAVSVQCKGRYLTRLRHIDDFAIFTFSETSIPKPMNSTFHHNQITFTWKWSTGSSDMKLNKTFNTFKSF